MKNWINSLSIRYKLTLLMTTICLITVGISTLIITFVQLSSLKNFTTENTNTKAELIASSAESAILFHDDESATNILKRLSNDPAIMYAAVILNDGEILANYKAIEKDNTQTSNFNIPTLINSNYLDVVHNITFQDEIIGYVLIRTNLNKFNEQMVNYAFINAFVLICSVGLAYILAANFQNIITKPINTLLRHIDKIYKTHDYSQQVDIKRNDEIGKLVTGFNHMLSAILTRETALSKHSEELQHLVDTRTKQLEQKAHYDSLTLLPNRYLLNDRLKQEIATSNREGKKLAILFLDLDRFKIINDSLGHPIGDQLLQSVSNRLSNIMREGDMVSRLGGDEFVFLLHNIVKSENAAIIADRIIAQFSKPFKLQDHTLHVSTSIGISIFPDDGIDSETLLKHADTSMYHAKEAGPGQYCYYQNEMNVASYSRLNMENQLREAIGKQEFSLVYQPIVDLKTGAIQCLEALIRWNNSELGCVPPDKFIAVAQDIGMIDDIGNWVIKTVCNQLGEWKSRGEDSIQVAVNISASHIMNLNLVEFIKNETKRNLIDIKQLKIEITEDVFLHNTKRIIDALNGITALGVEISIDDFGTGYSSLRYIQEFPVNVLKIDGMFIKEIERNASSQGIVSSIILLAHSLGMVTVCECVETKDQLDYVITQSCDFVQGYYFSAPLSPEDIFEMLSVKFEFEQIGKNVA